MMFGIPLREPLAKIGIGEAVGRMEGGSPVEKLPLESLEMGVKAQIRNANINMKLNTQNEQRNLKSHLPVGSQVSKYQHHVEKLS